MIRKSEICNEFIPGVVVDRDLLFLSSVVVLSVQVLLEYIRVFRIGPAASYLDECFKIFVDEKDSGRLVLTNIYLLVGAAFPMWISSDLNRINRLILLSGVISIGIGDSAASIVGSTFGRIRFPGSPKTLEGTLASILFQVIFIYFLSDLSWSVFASVAFVSFVEAFTTQVDNVVLPLVLYSLLTIVL